jgi:hypothetical protein
LKSFTAASSWLDSPAPNRPNFVDNTDPTDSNYVSIGCSVLFLWWLKDELGHNWGQIAFAGAATLAQTYANLTGKPKNQAWPTFIAAVNKKWPPGKPSGVKFDNTWGLP